MKTRRHDVDGERWWSCDRCVLTFPTHGAAIDHEQVDCDGDADRWFRRRERR